MIYWLSGSCREEESGERMRPQQDGRRNLGEAPGAWYQCIRAGVQKRGKTIGLLLGSILLATLITANLGCIKQLQKHSSSYFFSPVKEPGREMAQAGLAALV